ncbi:MAG TPA: Spy/CpxP family protein refolding chaperone [Stellaceae bacterium]|jgi:periplasmic protein CpxP/Spy|nr:Spy/CpxP family protein refolding chaperone [Stellaceae bacterium]
MIEISKRHGTFAAVVALTGALFIVPALAQTTMPSAPPPTPPTAPAMPAAPSAAPATPSTAPAAKPAPTKTSKRMSGVEARIKSLHARLKITAAQEPQWQPVAEAMRDNAATMEKLVSERNAKVKTMTAVDNLQTYSDIAQAHADGLKKLVSAFDPLYASMSDAQKKVADAVFRGIAEHHRAAHKPAAKPAAPAAPAPAPSQQ